MGYVHPEYMKYTQFFYVDKTFDPTRHTMLINDSLNTHQYWIDYFNGRVLPIIKKEIDWVAMIGCDSFLHLDGKNINDFFENNNIDNNITQIAFPWMRVFNFDDISCDTLTHNLNKFYSLSHCEHSYTMGNTKKIKHLIGNSHCFSSCNTIQNIYICDNKIQQFQSVVSPHDIFKHSIFSKNTKNYAIHIMLRNYDEIIVKDFFSWRNNDIISKHFYDSIINNDIKKFNEGTQTNRINTVTLRSQSHKVSFNLTKNILCNNNKINYHKTLVKKLLDANKLSDEHYDNFIYYVKNGKKKLPDDFRWNIYIKLNQDLNHMNEKESIEHYINFGNHEKRKYKYLNLPNDFNWKSYVSINNDLHDMDENDACFHYEKFGYNEKRKYK
jgi:hypothetical protein